MISPNFRFFLNGFQGYQKLHAERRHKNTPKRAKKKPTQIEGVEPLISDSESSAEEVKLKIRNLSENCFKFVYFAFLTFNHRQLYIFIQRK